MQHSGVVWALTVYFPVLIWEQVAFCCPVHWGNRTMVAAATIVITAAVDNECIPRQGTPSMLGDTYVPPFWPPFFDLLMIEHNLFGVLFLITNIETTFLGTSPSSIRSFGTKFNFF